MSSVRSLLLVLFAVGCGSSAREEQAEADAAPETDTMIEDVVIVDAVIETAPSCPTDMVHVDTFCIDKYEAPNIAGQKPLAFQTAYDGDAWCKKRGKRLCSEAEWVRACQGATKLPYPYGATYKRSTCNDDKTWKAPNWTVLGTYPSDASLAEAARLYQGDPSGSRTGCASEDGVMDLTGNVAEWVTRSFPNANNYDHVMKGCYWSGCYGGTPPSCGFVNPAHPGGFRSYEAGFRCCAALE
jgi:formylglycine-generating enzyme required for sulfatase activity